MSNRKLLVGSLSNDLLRIAKLIHRGSDQAAFKFIDQANRWNQELKKEDLAYHIGAIVHDLSKLLKEPELTSEFAEKSLMYSVILQNYTLHTD